MDYTDGTRNSGSYEYADLTGSDVTVVIMDTGIRCSHQEFTGLACSTHWTAYPNEPGDGNGHGTHCAGTAVGRTVGVAQGLSGVKLLDVKVLSNGGGGDGYLLIDGINEVANLASTSFLYPLGLEVDGARWMRLSKASLPSRTFRLP